MADKAVSELIEAERITATDLFVLEQNGTAKKLTGQVLLNWLTAAADGHGGIQSIQKVGTNGLADTYSIILADTTTFDFVVTNGKSVENIKKTGTSGLVDTYTISYNDGTSGTFTVTNGAKGDKGDNTYTWIKYASQKPTASSHSFGDVPDNWIGIYFGSADTAPTDWSQYQWFKIKGEKGDTGNPATLTSSKVEYQISDSGSIIPSGAWSESVPVVPQGRYLWTRTTNTFNTGAPVVAYSISRMGLDGTGSVSSVANISPDTNGNVPLTAEHIGAVPSTGGDMTGELKMNGQPISGLNAPTANDHAANMGFVNQQVKKAAPRNLLDNSDFTNPVNQRGQTSATQFDGYFIDRWVASGCDFNVLSDGLKFTAGHVYQKIPLSLFVDGKPYTVACKVDGEIICYSAIKGATIGAWEQGIVALFTPDQDIYMLHLTRIGSKYEWAALYDGEYTAETLPEYQPKGYGTELAECHRYYFDSDTVLRSSLSDNGNVANLLFPVPMRVVPTVAVNAIEGTAPDVVNASTGGVSWYATDKFTFDKITASADL